MTTTRSDCRRTAALTILLALSAASAAAQKPPPGADYIDDSFSSSLVDHVLVLRVADVRIDRSVKLERMNEIVEKTVRRMLRKSPYQIEYEPAPIAARVASQEDLDLLDGAWMSGLGDDEDRWVLLIAVRDITRKRTYGAAFGVVCSGYFFDKATGRAVWQHETVGSAGSGGLVGLATSGTLRIQAFSTCISNLLVTFPERKGAR